MTEVVREIRRLTFDDKDEMDEVIASQTGWYGVSPWKLRESADGSSSIGYASNWSRESEFITNVSGTDHFGMFENGQLNYIHITRYFNHNIFDGRRVIPNIGPFSTMTTIARRNKNVPIRFCTNGKSNFNILQLVNYGIINGSEAFGCNMFLFAHAGDPRPNNQVDVGDGKLWYYAPHRGGYDDNGEYVNWRGSTHYHGLIGEEILPGERSNYSWIRNNAVASTHSHRLIVYMYFRHNFES